MATDRHIQIPSPQFELHELVILHWKSPPGLPAAGIDWTPGIGGTRWPPCRMKSMRIDFFQRRRSSLGDAVVGLEWGDRGG
jgi:hypothetical protein